MANLIISCGMETRSPCSEKILLLLKSNMLSVYFGRIIILRCVWCRPHRHPSSACSEKIVDLSGFVALISTVGTKQNCRLIL